MKGKLQRFEDPETGWRLYAESKAHLDRGEFYISVTALLDHITHHRLKKWMKNNTAKAQEKTLKVAGDDGTAIHAAVEADLKGLPVRWPEHLTKVGGEWAKMKATYHFQGETEIQVYSNQFGYAGTADYVGHIFMPANPEKKIEERSLQAVGDWKSGRYSIKTGWQLAAYKHAAEELLGYKDLGMFGASLPRGGEPGNVFVYQHLDPCWKAFVCSWYTFKMLYWNTLAKLKWAWLDVDPIEVKPYLAGE